MSGWAGLGQPYADTVSRGSGMGVAMATTGSSRRCTRPACCSSSQLSETRSPLHGGMKLS